MEISQIRKKLKEHGVEEDDIKGIIRAVDSEVLRDIRLKSESQSGTEYMLVGVFLTVASIVGVIILGKLIILGGIGFVSGPGLFALGYQRYKKGRRKG